MSAPPITIAASVKQTATIIFLHGLGDTGHGWANAILALKAPYVKVICPTAAALKPGVSAVQFKFLKVMPKDLESLDANGPEDEDGINKAANMVHGLINSEVEQGIEPGRIVLGGFSQGGALALYSALIYPKRLGGVMALSCWLPLHKNFPSAVVGDNANIPIIQCHGDCDPIVQYKWGQMTASYLKSFARNIEFKTYKGMMHSSSEQEMRDLKEFVDKHLPVA